jgi:hypothetical protein
VKDREGKMDEEHGELRSETQLSCGPLRIHSDEGKVYVTGYGLWIEVQSEKEGRLVIEELEDQGFLMCF